MNAQEFCYWLQGHVELGGDRPTEEQWAQIKEHLQLVFTKVTTTSDQPRSLEDAMKDMRIPGQGQVFC